MACSDKQRKDGESLRRSLLLAKTRAAAASEKSELLKLKREAMALMKRIAPEEVEPSAGKKRKVIKTIVPRGLIEIMILYPHMPFYGFPEETLPNRSQEFHGFYARRKAIADKILEYEQGLDEVEVIVTRGRNERSGLRRSLRLAKTKAAAALESEILKLKREAKALMKRIAPEEVQPAAGKKRKVIKTLMPREAIAFMYQQALIKQFSVKGYAEDYTQVEVTDNDEN
ncbi:hypothetical protein HU200_017025 [Digitaria exilis]|uniref:Uncharacterized protein n=1 Tax=Digitaria exilis TaxID=1010633 RepID=A0A835F7S9_9POAL|nr:hypothetical protein HU200_017025 [Digitaria exilis]